MTYRPLPNPTQEQQAIAVKSGDGELIIINVYIPPVSSSPTAFIPSLSHLNHLLECLILGDFNAHHPQWHSEHGDDARGRHLADIIDHSTFAILNENTATRVSSNGCRSSPDISLASSDIFAYAAWRTIKALNSDHLPIVITLQREFSKVSSARRTFINFSKADWDGFYTACEKGFSNAATPTDAVTGERQFRHILLRAASHFIPAGRIPHVRPEFPSDAAALADERDALRARDPSNPRVSEISIEIQRLVTVHRRQKWPHHLDSCDLKTGTKNF